MKTIKVIMDQRMDAVNLDDTDVIEFTTTYFGSVIEKSIAVSSLTTGEKDDLKNIIDLCTYDIEQDAIVWKITEAAKTFDLSASYLRNTKDTTTLGEVAVDTPLIVVFEFPTFSANKTFELSLWYDNGFLAPELADLLAIGVDVVGDGKSFTIDNSIEVRVSFKKPVAASEVYVIDFKPLIID